MITNRSGEKDKVKKINVKEYKQETTIHQIPSNVTGDEQRFIKIPRFSIIREGKMGRAG